MKLRTLLLSMAASVVLFNGTANANVVVQSFSFTEGDICSSVDGVWNGSGKMTALDGMIKCGYSGTAKVTKVDNADNYSVYVSLHKDSGVCPNDEDYTLAGTCTNGVFVMQTDKVHLQGNVSGDGRAVSLSGTADVEILGHTVRADINYMNMHKQ
jgi:hypothetical protein